MVIEREYLFGRPEDQTPEIHLRVVGLPRPQGSKKTIVNPSGKVSVMEQVEGVKEWRDLIASFCRMRWKGEPLDGALHAAMMFTLPRPVGHPKTIPTHPISTPDLDKLARAAGDALKIGKVIKDDSRIVGFWRPDHDFPALGKTYPLGSPGVMDPMALDMPGVAISLWLVASR